MNRKDRKYAFALTTPALIFFVLCFGYPILLLIYNSFFDVNLMNMDNKVFVGFSNYKKIFMSKADGELFLRTFQYTAITLTTEFLLGFAAALIFNAIGKKSQIFRTIFLFPLMIAPVVAGLLWKYMLSSNFGILNYILNRLRLINSVDQIAWLSDPNLVIYSVAIPDIWLTTCFVMMVIYTGLQNIPNELKEAAKIDGANSIQSFNYVTLPLLRPVVATVLILRGIDAARTFDAIYLMTGGGPLKRSEVLSLRIYQTMIRYGRLGEASAMATLFLIALLSICLIAYKLIYNPSQNAS